MTILRRIQSYHEGQDMIHVMTSLGLVCAVITSVSVMNVCMVNSDLMMRSSRLLKKHTFRDVYSVIVSIEEQQGMVCNCISRVVTDTYNVLFIERYVP